MIDFPNAKINLGLRVTERRADGYHSIETLFLPIDFCDILEIIPNKSGNADITVTGLVPEGDPQDNLCMKAWEMLHTENNIPGVAIYLHKQIPSGAGLGGGSSNAAITLKMLNELFHLSLSSDTLEKYALRLGSDCPFFLHNRPMIARGRGEILTPVILSLHGYYLALVVPPVHVSTRLAYAGVVPKQPEKPIEEILRLGVENWKGLLINDFEETVFRKFPLLADIKQKLYDAGAIYASMSGSGSSIYGIFNSKPNIQSVACENRTFIQKIGSPLI